MISYTITVQKTQGQYRISETSSRNSIFKLLWDGISDGNFDPPSNHLPGFLNDVSETQTYVKNILHKSDGCFSQGNTYSKKDTVVQYDGFDDPNPSNFEGTKVFYYSFTNDTNGGFTQKNSETWEDNVTGIYVDETFESIQSVTPTTISVATSTTSQVTTNASTTQVTTVYILTGTTISSQSGTGTTAVATTKYTESESTVGTFVNVPTTVTRTTSSQVQTQLVTNENGIVFPPRDTATVFAHFKNEVLWLPTATNLPAAGPWALSDLGSSFASDVTAKPLYSTSPLIVLGEDQARFPENNPEENFETITTHTFAAGAPKTFWRSTSSGFPLTSEEMGAQNISTTTQQVTVQGSAENNPALTQTAMQIGSRVSLSAEVVDFNVSFQQFPDFTFTTTRYAGTWSQTSSFAYNGPLIVDGVTFTNVTIDEAGGQTIEGTNVERIRVRVWSPCAVSHVETSFTQNWGGYGQERPEVYSKISLGADLHRRSFAELHPGVSVPYPGTTSWTSGNETFRASLSGNVVTILTLDKNTSSSRSYQFQGDGPPHTEQRSGREFFENFSGLPRISFFGPHAATGKVETRAVPGTYVQVSQDSLGDYTLNTVEKATTENNTISKNVVIFPGEKSYYTTTQGENFIVLPRNVVP